MWNIYTHTYPAIPGEEKYYGFMDSPSSPESGGRYGLKRDRKELGPQKHGVNEALIEMLLAQKVPLNKLEKGISTLGGGSPCAPSQVSRKQSGLRSSLTSWVCTFEQ